MKISTSKLAGLELDWAVQKVLFARQDYVKPWVLERHAAGDPCGSASSDWAQGGPIIERERIDVFSVANGKEWCAQSDVRSHSSYGPTPLVAAMRCITLAVLGEEVEVPENLFSQP